ncbi:MAG: EAL domain-containing protein [Pseudomonadota bacterium]
MRHRIADVFTGPMALALLPISLMAWNALGAQIGLLIALITVPALVVLTALADRHLRRNLAVARVSHIENAGESLEIALRAALYRGGLRQSSILCIIIELKLHDPTLDPKMEAEWTYQNAVLIGSFLRRRDQVYVLGHQRFGAIMDAGRDVSDKDALALAGRLRRDVKNAAVRRYRDSSLDALVGISVSPKNTIVVARDMIAAASKALSAARGPYASDVQLHAPNLVRDEGRTGVLRRDIGRALETEEFRGWFQPQVCTKTGRVTGFETLARWMHPVEGMIQPFRFIPILERRGMMPLLQERMLCEALSGFEAWRRICDDPPAVGLNLAPEDLLDPTLPDRILWELDRRKIEPSFLNIEVLETVVAQSPDDVTALNIKRLSDIGCGIDLDDFGTGHASISSLRQFALHRLKIERSFIQGIEDNPDQESMVAAILTMANQLRLDTVAEGVETLEERACLTRLGCGHLQGFAIAHPMPLHDALTWLSARSETTDLPKIAGSRAG